MGSSPEIDTEPSALGDASTAADVPLEMANTAAAIEAVSTPRRLLVAASASLVERLAGWDRYRITKRLGAGTMGEVYHAVDLRLNRPVALKFLLTESDDFARRLANEAQAQARVDHQHVCKVYEVGSVLGHCYIAMQFVEGKTLAEAAREMSLEEKMLVVAKVAEALHAAHRQGLIHRDMKPQNVLVERGEDGAWKPYVTDFGLARDLSQTDQTLSSTAGTPLYMAPEQILGDVQSFDRRTDVYALGATLYELAVGRTPFEGNVLTLVQRVLREEPKPMRSIAAAIPRDLDAIALKCLEKLRARRYDTARALAEDLRRWLDGEPVRARRASLSYRAKKAVARHKAVAAVSFVAVLSASALGVAFVRERLAAGDAARLGEELGRETEAIDGIMRVSALLPLHDVTADKELVRARMVAIEKKAEGADDGLKSQVAYALGRAALALDEPAEARAHLETAERAGLRTPGVSYALGLALGGLYRAARAEVAKRPPSDQRKAKEAELDASLRDPALASLRKGAGAARASSAYAEGLLAFFEGKSEEALAKAKDARAEDPWLFEAWKLEGEILVVRARDEKFRGDLALAGDDLKHAHQAFAAASGIARSDADAYDGDCAAAIELMQVIDQQGGSEREAFESARSACGKALAVDPHRVSALDRHSEAAWRFGDFEEQHGRVGTSLFDDAEKAAREALEIDPRDVEAHRNLAFSFEGHSFDADTQGKGEERLSLLLEARRACDDGLAIAAGASLLEFTHAVVDREVAVATVALGRDPRADFRESIDHASRVIEIEPAFAYAYSYRGVSWLGLGLYQDEHGEDAAAAFDRAVSDAEKALSFDPAHPALVGDLATAVLTRAEFQWDRGSDPETELRRAASLYERALESKPNLPITRRRLADARRALAEAAFLRGEDPSREVQRARAELDAARAIDAKALRGSPTPFLLALIEAAHAVQSNQRADSLLDAAEEALDPHDADADQMRSRLFRYRAEAKFLRHLDASREIEIGISHADKALAGDDENDEARGAKAAMLAIQALATKDPAAARGSSAKAVAELARIKNDAPVVRESQALVERARHLAEP